MSGDIHVCCFTTELDDMRRKDQGDDIKVLAALKVSGRFSVFEATANQTVARTIERLQKRGLMETTPEGFPWTKVKVTELGDKLLQRSKMEHELFARAEGR